MRFEPRHAFVRAPVASARRVQPRPRADDPVHSSARPSDIGASDFAVLLAARNDGAPFAATPHRAARDGVETARSLIARGGASDSRWYRHLARHLELAFEDKWPRLAQPLDAARALDSGIVKLAHGGGWLVAPTDDTLRLLLAIRDAGGRVPPCLRLTTPAHLAAIIQLRAEHVVLYAASRRLPDSAPRLSAKGAFSTAAKAFVIAAALAAVSMTITAPRASLAIIGLMFFASLVFRLVVCAAGLPRDDVECVTPRDRDMPFYSVLVPLHREAAMVEKLVAALAGLDYPRSKLEIIVLLEQDDLETRAALRAIDLPAYFRVVVVPEGMPRTKPRALNVGLFLAKGALLTVYDAEDRPEPDQLRRAAQRFRDGPPKLACLQARLAVGNGAAGLLARLFAVEYASLFNLFNVGLGRLGLPMALGGTSNHFRSDVLRAVGGWDAWNVTEDADLGLRLARFGYMSDVLASTTWEDALTKPGRWFLQRRRWTKGWMQTTVVLVRDGRGVLRDLGAVRSCAVALLLVNLVLCPLTTPLFSLLVALDLAKSGLPTPRGIIEITEATTGVSVVALGVFSMLWCGYMGSRDTARAAFGKSVPWLLPYQAMISAAAWIGLVELFRDPYHWHKTDHSPET